jgi:hypothetical protein
MTPAGLPHSDTPGSQLGCQLPRAYRRLQRPSSALDAKASTMCPSQLVSQTLNKNHKETHTPPRPITPQQGLQKDQTTTTPLREKLLSDARVHYPLTKHPPHQPPTTPPPRPARERRATRTSPPPEEQLPGRGRLIPQGPTVCRTPTDPQPAPGSTPTPPRAKRHAELPDVLRDRPQTKGMVRR